MTSKRKFYRHKIVVEVLTNRPIPGGMYLEDIVREGATGDFVLDWKIESELIDGSVMADELGRLRSEPATFGLTDDGEDEDQDLDE
jgi:hypothetical protein